MSEPADIALRFLILEKAEDLAVDADQLVGRVDLVFERGFLDRGQDDICAERDVDRDHLVAGRLLLRRGGFDGPLVQPEHVGRIGHAELRRDQRIEESIVARHRSERRRGVLLARDGGAGADLRQHSAVLRAHYSHARREAPPAQP